MAEPKHREYSPGRLETGTAAAAAVNDSTVEKGKILKNLVAELNLESNYPEEP